MKLSLFAILLFAVIISLCGCKPPVPKKQKYECESIPFLSEEHVEHSDEEKTGSEKFKHPKSIKSAMKQANQPRNIERRVSFNENIDICKNSLSSFDDSGIFWLSFKNFAPIIFKQCELFPVNSAEREFIALIQDCIERNYGMFDLLYRSVSKFKSYDSYVYQIEQNIEGETILFPNSTEFMTSKAIREYFEETIIAFLDDLIPAYELNEHLLNSVQRMNEKTKIDPKFLVKLAQEDDKIVAVWESFWKIFRTFSLDKYMQGLSGIRKTINHLEFNQIDLEEANKRLNYSLSKLFSNSADINEVLTSAYAIDFELLQRATKAFYSYVKKALKVDGAFLSK